MSWTDDLEKCKLYEWACNHGKVFAFSEIDKSKDTYYTMFNNVDNAIIFGFNNMPELEEQLQKLWNDQQDYDLVKKVCAVAAFKREPVQEDSLKKDQSLVEIPEFKYAF